MYKLSYAAAAAAITAFASTGCSVIDKATGNDNANTTTVNGTAVAASKNAKLEATFDGEKLSLSDPKCAKTGGKIAMTGGTSAEISSSDTSVVAQLDESGSDVTLVSFTNAPGGGTYTYSAGTTKGSKPSVEKEKNTFTITGSIGKLALVKKGSAKETKDFTIKATCPGI